MTNETATTILDFPDINNGFIGASSMEEICRNYIEALHSTGDIINGMYANKLYEFLDAIEKIPFLDEEFHELQVFLRNLVKQIQDLHIKVEFNQELITLEHFALKALTRRKNWKSLNAKIRLFLCKYMNLIQKEIQSSPNHPSNDLKETDLDLIRDLLGIKLVVCYSGDREIGKKLCYKLMNEVLCFFIFKRRCNPLNAEKAISLNSPPELDIRLKPKVKDYYMNERADKYHALHTCVKTRSGLIFEIQVLLLSDHLEAQKTHKQHKDERYANLDIEFDYKKINLPNVVFDEDGNLLCDYAGLLESTSIFGKI